MKDVLITKPIIPDDVPQIEEVFYKSWLNTYPNQEIGIAAEDIEELFKDRAQRAANRLNHLAALPSNEIFLVAKKDGVVIGVCRILIHKNYNQVQSIYILPEYQGLGVGTALWSQACKFSDPSKKMIVHVATYNKQAIDFYKELGFIDAGKRFTEERHRMQKSGVLIPEMEMCRNATPIQ